MGRGRILSGGPEGRYELELDVGAVKLQARILQYQLMIDALQPVIDTYAQQAEQARARRDADRVTLDAAIAQYESLMRDPEASDSARDQARRAVDSATAAVMRATATLQASETLVKSKELERAGLEKQRAGLASVPGRRNVMAWCADLTEDAEGEVGTIEVPGEPQEVLIAPRGRPPILPDGTLLRREAMSGPQAYFNAAVLPGWQKWRPTYRFGIASDVDPIANTMSVTLSDARSSADRLDVNQQLVLTEVPVSYMECNAGAFSDGDEVLVQFTGQRWENPKVIGFRREPKPCGWSAWWGTFSSYTMYLFGQAGAERYFDLPIDEYLVEYRAGGGGWTALTPVGDTFEQRTWRDIGAPDDGSVVQPQLWVLKSGSYQNSYLSLQPLLHRTGTQYIGTGVNEFRLSRAGRQVFHYAVATSDFNTSNPAPNARRIYPLLVGGLSIVEPAVNEQPLMHVVNGYIPGWEPGG